MDAGHHAKEDKEFKLETLTLDNSYFNDSGPGHWVVVTEVIAAGTFGPFITAFCTELGKRFGGTVADWVSRAKFSRLSDNEIQVTIKMDDAVIIADIDEGLSDEAKLALLDLDVESCEVMP